MDQGVGREIKRFREERGWSQAKLAVEADMSVSGVSMIENGQRNLTTTTLVKLAGAFGVEVRDLFPLGQAPLPEASEERCHLIPLMDYNILILSKLSKDHKPFLTNLPEDLPPSRSLMVFQRVKEFMYTCDLLEHALDEQGATDVVISLLDRAERGEPVPDDLLEKARAFEKVWTELFFEVWTSANDWVESQRKRPEVMEYSNKDRKEADGRLARTTGVIHLDFRGEQQDKRGVNPWGVRAEGAG